MSSGTHPATTETTVHGNDNDDEVKLLGGSSSSIPREPSMFTTDSELPTNTLVTPLLTDLYQITMIYSYYMNDRHTIPSIFELFFRKNPFGGEYTICCGLDECLKYINTFHFTLEDIQYLQSIPSLSYCQPKFFEYLLQLNTKSHDITIRAIPDGTIVFPRIPLMIIEAPLIIGQILETTLLSLMNYPTLIATNATRMVYAAVASNSNIHTSSNMNSSSSTVVLSRQTSSSSLSISQHQNISTTATGSAGTTIVDVPALPKQCYQIPVCVELGLRRAQGPDGGFSASKYSNIGGFVGTSNVLAGKICHLPVIGTHAHSYVQSYSSLSEVRNNTLRRNNTNNNTNNNNSKKDVNDTTTTNDRSLDEKGHSNNNNNDPEDEEVMILPLVLEYRKQLSGTMDVSYSLTNDGELAAFIAYATSFPHSFVSLIDTYNTLSSGLLNFIMVALVLDDLGYEPRGIRLDSGDLAYLSMECALLFQKFTQVYYPNRTFFHELKIVASNDINEDVLHALNKQDHAITMYGIGTNLVTCQAQPALGGVYKLVELDGKPRIKLSQDISKVLIPGRKKVFRLTGKDGKLLLDVMLLHNESIPKVGERILCRHPFIERKRAAVTPSMVNELHVIVYQDGCIVPNANRTNEQAKVYVQQQLHTIRSDILRYTNPTPYKVSVSENLFQFLHNLWQAETPVAELS
jgi:nicotinate phosphoribosyltransferase